MTRPAVAVVPPSPSRRLSSRSVWRAAMGLALATLALFGFAYSVLGTALGAALFPAAAHGSLVERDGRVVGSSLVAQPFADSRYFQPRPSASNYDPMVLAGSNQARTNPDLRRRIEEARVAVAAREGVGIDAVPDDLVTQSGGAIDPHVSPAAARLQVRRVAAARGLGVDAVQALVDAHTQGPTLGVFGAARVNVLELNLALDAIAAAPPSR